jgi:hypothetical protein
MNVVHIALLALAGCIKAPALILVDKQTALEQQAAGSYPALDDDLARAGIAPRPTPFTRAQLESGAGEKTLSSESAAESEPLQLDGLLTRRCVGESLDGTLVVTSASCTGTVDVAQLNHMIERANRDRFQVWRYLQAKRPKSSLAEVRRQWRELHLGGVVCGGQVQRTDGGWEPKTC